MSNNMMATKEAGDALGEMLKVNNTLTELDISKTALFSSGNSWSGADGPGFAEGISKGLVDNGALSIANVMGNRIGKEMLSKLQEIMRSKPNLISLCGIADDATEADLSGLNMDADDAIILASELPDKGALTKFDISNCGLRAEGGKALAVALKGNDVMTELNVAGNELGLKSDGSNCDTGIIAIADAIPDMGALTSLDISGNGIGAYHDRSQWVSTPEGSCLCPSTMLHLICLLYIY
jgi:hypothetical protein